METLEIGNITIKYNKEDWSREQSKQKIVKKIKNEAIAIVLLVLLFVGIIQIGTKFIGYKLSAIIGLSILTVFLFYVEYYIEYLLYKNEIVEYRALDYFSKLSAINTDAVIETHNVVVYTNKNNKKETKEKLDDLLKRLKCTYRITYEDRYSVKDNTPIKVAIDATRKSIAEIYVTIV